MSQVEAPVRVDGRILQQKAPSLCHIPALAPVARVSREGMFQEAEALPPPDDGRWAPACPTAIALSGSTAIARLAGP